MSFRPFDWLFKKCTNPVFKDRKIQFTIVLTCVYFLLTIFAAAGFYKITVLYDLITYSFFGLSLIVISRMPP